MSSTNPIKRLPIVEVEWVDSMGYSGWTTRERRIEDLDKVEDLDHVSVGYLLKRTKDYIAVTQSIGRVGNVDNSMQIPRCAVRSVTVLKKEGEAMAPKRPAAKPTGRMTKAQDARMDKKNGIKEGSKRDSGVDGRYGIKE